MLPISPCSQNLTDLILHLKKSTRSLAPYFNDKGLEFAAQMLIQEKAETISGNLPIFPPISPSLLAQNKTKAFEVDPNLRAEVAHQIFLINKNTLDKLGDSEKNSIALGQLYVRLHLSGPQITNVLQVFANNQEENFQFLKDELLQDDLKALATIFEVLSKLVVQKYATCPELIYTEGEYNNSKTLIILEPEGIELFKKASKFFSRLANESITK